MKKRKVEEKIRCIAYLSTDADIYTAEVRENKQLRYLKEYANAHGIVITHIIRRNGLGKKRVNEQWQQEKIIKEEH